MDAASSIFIPGRRRRINAIAICLNVVLPWFVFSVIFFLMIISFHHREPNTTYAMIGAFALIPLAAAGGLAWSTKREYDPSWYKLSFLMLLVAIILALVGGAYTYYNFLKPYYDYAVLQTYPQLDVSKTSGRNVQDAGRVYFAAGTHIDLTRSWHFQAGKVYCVAPIVGAGQAADAPVDFWAIGTDCCAIGASDFRCGDYSKAAARSGLRFLESDSWFPERHLYRLAVEGAEGLFNIKSPNPMFFTWVQDPLNMMNELKHEGWGYFMLSVQAFFIFNLTVTFLATWRFAYLGRAEQKSLLGDDEA